MKTLRLLNLFVLCIPVFLFAQNQPAKNYCWQLIKQNAATIGINASDINNWRISDIHIDQHANTTYIYLQQSYNGIDIENAINTVCFKAGKLSVSNLTAIKNYTAANKTIAPSITAVQALTKAAAAIDLQLKTAAVQLSTTPESHTQEFGSSGISYNNIPVKLLWTNTNEAGINKLAWEVLISSNINNALWRILIDAQIGNV